MTFDTEAVRIAIFKAGGMEPPIAALPNYRASTEEEDAVRKQWERLREEIEAAMDRERVPGWGYIFAPHIETLHGRILDRWGRLGEQAIFDDCLALTAKSAVDRAALLYGFGCLRLALTMTHHSELAELVADRELALMTGTGIGRLNDAATPGSDAEVAGGAAVSPGAGPGEAVGGAWGEPVATDATADTGAAPAAA